MKTLQCQYCKGTATLCDSSAVYKKSYGLIYLCGCGARVGAHKNSKKHKPMGILADKELRELRIEFHSLFDNTYKNKKDRNKQYKWLSESIGISQKECHGATMENDTIKKAILFLKSEMSKQ